MAREFSPTAKSKGDVSSWAADFLMEGPSNGQRLQPGPIVSRSATPQSISPYSVPSSGLTLVLLDHMQRQVNPSCL